MALALLRSALVPALAVLMLAAEGHAMDGYGVAGPFLLIIEHLEPCPASIKLDVPFWISFKMRRDRSRLGRPAPHYYISTNATSAFVFDDAVEASMDLASWSSRGGWKPNAQFGRVPRFCSFLERNVPDLFRRLKESTLTDPNRTCPFPPGNNVSANLSTEVDKDMPSIPFFFYGKYRSTFQLSHTATRRRLACCVVRFSIVPKYVQQR